MSKTAARASNSGGLFRVRQGCRKRLHEHPSSGGLFRKLRATILNLYMHDGELLFSIVASIRFFLLCARLLDTCNDNVDETEAANAAIQ